MHCEQMDHASVRLVLPDRTDHILVNDNKKEAPEVTVVQEKDLFMARADTHPDCIPAEKIKVRAFPYHELLGQVLAGLAGTIAAAEETRRGLRRRRYALLLR